MRRQRRPEVILSSGRSKFLSCLIANRVDGHIHLLIQIRTFILLNTIELLFMKRFILLMLLLHVFALSYAQKKSKVAAPSTPSKTEQLDSFIQSAMQKWKTTGLSVTVVKEGDVIFKKGYGVTDIRTNEPFTTSTIAFCASTTKAMTAACLGMLVDEGKIKWDDKLKNILPAFRLYDPYVSDELTIKDLLTHNAGLGNADNLWVFGFNTTEILNRMKFMKPAYPYHASFIYQNLMYVVAGEVVKQISGKTWDAFIQERLFQPLEMKHTYTLFKDSYQEPSRMTPHWMYGDTVIKPIEALDFGEFNPAGSVVSNADDISHWLQFLQDSAKWKGQRLLSAASYTEMFRPQSFVTPAEFYPTQAKTKPHWMTYGLGWFQQDYRGKMIQFHTGSLDGAIAIHGFIPEEKFSIYLFANLDHNEVRHAILWKAIDLWSFNDNHRDWNNELYDLYKARRDAGYKAEKDKEAKRILNTSPSLSLSQYAGEFSNELYGKANITYTNGKLLIELPNHFNLTLTHWNFDTFKGAFNHEWYGPAFVRFNLNTDGVVNSVDIDGDVYQKIK